MSQTATLAGGSLRVIFHRTPDRWAHRIEQLTEAGAIRLMESVEGSPDESWPPAPPLQNAQVQEGPCGPICLLVGMAGRSLWSLSCSLDTARGKATFDAAARVKERPPWLGSKYRISPDAKARQDGHPMLVVAGEAALRIESDPAGRWEADLFEIPAQIPEGPWPLTVRWQYSVAVLGGSVET